MQSNPVSRIREIFANGIRNPGFWNPEFQMRLEPGIQVPLTQNQSTWLGIQIPRLFLIPLHEAICYNRENYCLTSVHRETHFRSIR